MPIKRANGEGYVYKRGSSYYARMRTYQNGELKGEITKGGFKTARDARRWCEEHRAVSLTRKASTLSDYYEIVYKNDIEKLTRGKKTNYITAWKRLEPLHNRRVDTITATELIDIVTKTTSTYNPARDIKTLLTKLFKLIGADKLNDKDLPSYIPLPQNEEKEQGTFTEEEIAAVYNLYVSNKDRIAACVVLMIYTSMMPAELFGLEISMIDISKRIISGAGRKTASRKKADIVFPSFLTGMIQFLMDTAPSERIIEIDYPEKFYPLYYDVLQRAGCRRLTPYACRHTTNTLLAKDPTISNATVAQVMRHSERMNERYTHIGMEDALAAVDQLAPPATT